MSETVEVILIARKKQYGDTWLIAGKVIKLIFDEAPLDRLILSNYFHNWVIILSKLIRICFTPYEADHWRDIAGYATLVLNDLDNDKE